MFVLLLLVWVCDTSILVGDSNLESFLTTDACFYPEYLVSLCVRCRLHVAFLSCFVRTTENAFIGLMRFTVKPPTSSENCFRVLPKPEKIYCEAHPPINYITLLLCPPKDPENIP